MTQTSYVTYTATLQLKHSDKVLQPTLKEYIPGGCPPRGIMVKAMDCGIVVREFVLQSRYYVHFRANTLGDGMNTLIIPAMGQIVPLLFF